MAHNVLAVNPFDVLLRLHQEQGAIDKAFSFWIRSYRDPPIRTVAALIECCPRVDWLFWFLEQLTKLELIDPTVVLKAGWAVRSHIDGIRKGLCYTATRGEYMPHAEGLRTLRAILKSELY